jgi:chemotaxis protein CheD
MASFELMPGDVALGYAGDELKTLLGSCVSVILTDPRRTVGVMCHIVHVGHPSAGNHNNTAYGSVAMAEMTRRLFSIGFSPRSCQAYVVGGGNMFPTLFTHHHVGTNNIDWVLGYLAHHKIGVLKQDLGGHGYRKLTWTVGLNEPMVETVFSS